MSRQGQFGPVIAHRGASARAPENTAAAFEAAIAAGCDMIELDARLTADLQLVVLHDDALGRFGHAGRASARSLAELRALDAGGWFGPEHAGQSFLGLEEALSLVGGRVPVNVELKLESAGAGDPRAAALVAGALAACGSAPVLFSTFVAAVFAELRRQAPATAAARLLGPAQLGGVAGALATIAGGAGLPVGPAVSARLSHWIDSAACAGAEGIHLHQALVGGRVIAAVHAARLALRVYTVNDPGRARAFLDAGCEGVFTDDVTAVRAALPERPPPDGGSGA